jgi:hypothetical protein
MISALFGGLTKLLIAYSAKKTTKIRKENVQRISPFCTQNTTLICQSDLNQTKQLF